MFSLGRAYATKTSLLRLGADVNFHHEKYGWTPLIRASVVGELEVVDLLIREGAEVNQVDRQGRSALICASRNGFLDIARALMKAGADVGAVSKTGKTALDLACVMGGCSKKEMELLLRTPPGQL